MSRFLIVSDLDGTLLGDDNALADFAQWHSQHQHEVALVYSSGRACDSMLASLRNTCLPTPVAMIGNVGTEIRHWPGLEPAHDWPSIAPHAWSIRGIRALAASFPRLQLQPDDCQSSYKISYFLHRAALPELQDLHASLTNTGYACEIVYSSQRDLDILPQGVNKGTAARYLANSLNFSPRHTIVCGDSGNDLAMFRQGFRGVVVDNALAELKMHAETPVYLARQPFAAGVREGIEFWLAHAR